MIAIVDYGVGNLFSLEQSFRAIGAEVRLRLLLRSSICYPWVRSSYNTTQLR